MTFPTPYEVSWYSFNEDAGQNDLGNDAEAWADPVPRKVIGWTGVQTEKLGVFASRSITDRNLQVPPDFTFKLRDRCGLPDGLYEVIGSNDRCHGFHGWQPGNVVNLKLVV